LHGATMQHVNRGEFLATPLYLPPLEEQRRIAAILDQAETLRTQRRQALAHLDTLTQSLFLDMFGDPATNSKGWPVSQIGNEAKLQGGFAFKSTDYISDGIKLVKISNVHRDSLTWDDVDQLPESYLETYKSFALSVGDVVIALTRPIIQSLDSVKIAVVSKVDIPSLLNQRVGRFVFKKMSRLDLEYLLGFCRSKAFFNAVKKFCSESLQPNMSTGQVEALEIPLPPLALQQTFATRIQAIEALKTTHRSALTQIDALFASLQQRAFAGEL
jgi:type I restriction enzyme, S subunit